MTDDRKELLATIAEMRRALEEARRDRDLNMYAVDMIDRALSPDAGKLHLERDAAMERVVGAWSEWRALSRNGQLSEEQERDLGNEIDAAMDALDALDVKERK